MIRMRGLSRFEFYFVMAVIGIIVLVGIQRYVKLAEQTRRFSFEVVAQHFNTSVYNLHARWMLARNRMQQREFVPVERLRIYFSEAGWPITAVEDAGLAVGDDTTTIKSGDEQTPLTVSLASCKSLWYGLLQNPAALSYQGGDAYGSRPYHLSLSPGGNCRFEFITNEPATYYFEYSSTTGQVTIQVPAMTKDSY